MRITLLLISLSIFSCSPNWHLKRAISKGAMVTSDTVYQTVEVIRPEIRIDTLFQQVNFNDTIFFTKEKVVTKVKINTEEKTVYIETECPADTVRIEVPVAVNTVIKSKRTIWPWLIVAFVLGGITVIYFKRK